MPANFDPFQRFIMRTCALPFTPAVLCTESFPIKKICVLANFRTWTRVIADVEIEVTFVAASSKSIKIG
jgi:hypothetical protein